MRNRLLRAMLQWTVDNVLRFLPAVYCLLLSGWVLVATMGAQVGHADS
jgi:hypothetical protein